MEGVSVAGTINYGLTRLIILRDIRPSPRLRRVLIFVGFHNEVWPAFLRGLDRQCGMGGECSSLLLQRAGQRGRFRREGGPP